MEIKVFINFEAWVDNLVQYTPVKEAYTRLLGMGYTERELLSRFNKYFSACV